MDGTAFSCCVHNKLTSGVSDWAVLERCSDNSQLSGNYDPLRTACSTCGRNCTCRKCKPWRRKCLLSTRPKWTWFNVLCSLNLLLLLASLSHAVLNGLSRTMSVKKTSRLRLHFLLLIACFLGGTFLPFASCQGSLQSSPSVKSQLNNAVVYVGSAFSYNISTSVFDCEVDSIVVSETADRFLSHWLSYNSEKKQLYGVPSDKDEGTYNILVVALTKDSAVRGHVCGSRSFSIVVMPVSNELPVSVHFGTGGFRSYHKSSPSLSCLPGMQTVLGTVVLNADMQSLNGHERMVLLLKMADHLKIHTSKVSFFPGESSHPMTEQLDNLAIMAAGVGDGRFAKGSRSLVTWNIGCGAFKLEDAAFSRLETDSQDGTISTLLGFPVVGWHVMSGVQKNLARRRVRRAAGGIGFTPTPTPTATSAAPTRMSNMSTSVVMSRTVTLTSSAGSINSTITLPVSTSVTLSVAPNRTIIQSTDASINTTIFSQSLPRTIQSSTLGINFTVSSQSPNSTDIQSSSVSINVTTSSRSFSVNFTVSSQSPNSTDIQTSSVSRNVTTSSRSFSKTVIQSSTVTNFSSSMTSFSPTSILSSSVLTGVSFTPVLSRNATQFVNRTSSLVTTPSLNLTFITRTASPSISLSVPLISSLSLPTTTRAGNSSIFVMSPNESATFVSSSPIVSLFSMTPLSNVTVLIPSTPQFNSTEVTRTSQFAVSSNITLITSTSLLSSPSLARTTFQPTSAITISASQLNSSTPNVTSPALSTLPSPTVITSNRSVTVATTSVLVTASVNQTINSSSILSATVTRTFSISPTSSLVILVPNTTSLENVTSFMTSGFVTSSPALLPSTSQLESTMLLNRTLPMPVSTFLTTSSVPTMTSTQRSTFAITSSLVPSLNFSSVTLSISLIQPSSTLVSSSSSERLNVTYCTSVPTMTSTQRSTFAITSFLVSSLNFSSFTLSSSLIQPSSSERLNVTSAGNTTSVVANITSATLQPSVTSATSVNMSSLTASPLVTSVNLTSVVTTVNATTSSLPSSSALFSSNTTSSVTATDATQTVSVLPTSSVPATAPPTSPPNLPPLLLNNIGRVRAPAGKALQFTIPDDTFYDREDRATTRDLTLSMTLANGSNIPTDFWLQFDIASQTINGLPLDEHVPDGILGQVLVLRARDNNSAETFDAFEVLVVPSETPVVQELRVRITNEFATFNLALKLALLKKIAAYYDDADESKIRVLTFSPGSVIMTWTNDSLPTDSCDEEKLQYVTNKMLLPNGEVREEFREALQGFPVVSASQERFGVCNGSFIVPTETPIDPARKEARVEEHLWYKHVLVGLLIIVIIIVLVALLIWYCRRRRPKPLEEKRTFKKRKPIVLGPEIELKPLPGKPLVLPDDDPSLTPSYISETSFNKPTYSDDEDEEDYGKRSPSVVYEPPPPFYPAQDDDPRNSPPPAYLMPPMY